MISTPKEALYIILGKLPLKYIIKTRRLMYWWKLIHTDEKELTNKFYRAQKLMKEKTDWIQQIIQDLKDLNLKISDEEVSNM